jgi:hypothetical protein
MKTGLRYLTRLGFIGLLVGYTCLGCSGAGQQLEKWQADLIKKLNLNQSESSDEARRKKKDVYFIHTTRWSWETLRDVAEWYTGDSKNRKVLAAINPDVGPKKLAAGSEIFIPVILLKTRIALPITYAGDYCKKCYRHTVRWPGESMSLIASWYTGAAKNWQKLAKANPRINPNRIEKGNVIVIPPALLKNKKRLPQREAARYTAGFFAHTVQQDGEKIKMIASWYTGDAANWEIIARANPKLQPHALAAGNEIFIPSKLLKTRQPIPKSPPARTAETPKPQPTAENPKPQPTAVEKKVTPVEEEIKIFGPKQFPKS